ncbi:MAG: ABC transporter ATP-binding protein [Thermacetogeniaceae bacterium]
MIRITNIVKAFGNNIAVNDVSLHVKKQEIVGLVGPDGAGKTTLLRMVCGLITPDRGAVSIMGSNPQRLERAKENLGYMPQRFSLYGDLTVMENIIFFGSMYQLSRQVIRERAAEVFAVTKLSGFERRLADNLSGGMRQKLALTCALITRPGILVLDEPTYGVDPESRKDFWKILYRLNQEGRTILVTTPYMDEAELCHTVAFINQGRVIKVDSPLQLKRDFPYQLLEVRVDSRDPDLFRGLDLVLDASFYGDKYHLVVANAATARSAVAGHLARLNIPVLRLLQIAPTMEDIFVSLAEQEVS